MGKAMLSKRKVFYGWWIILASAVGLFVCYSSILSFTFGVFLDPLSREFHWSRSAISFGYSISVIAMTVCVPFIGQLVDRIGARRVIIIASLVVNLGVISFYFLSANILHFYAVYLALGIAGGGSLQLPYLRVISHWFSQKRGLAMGLAMIGLGLGGLIMPPLAQSLILAFGWRWAYVIIGLLSLVVTISVIGIIKETPQAVGLLPDGKEATSAKSEVVVDQDRVAKPSDVWRLGTFWIMVAAFLLVGASAHGCLTHLAPMLIDRGISPERAALTTSLFGGALLFGRVATGYLLDRFFAPYVAACFFCAAALGLLLLSSTTTTEPFVAATVIAVSLVGMAMGAEGDLMPYMVSHYFGLRSFGEIYGYVLAGFSVGVMTGPPVMGLGFDFTGSYRLPLWVFAFCTFLAAGLMFFLVVGRPLSFRKTLDVVTDKL